MATAFRVSSVGCNRYTERLDESQKGEWSIHGSNALVDFDIRLLREFQGVQTCPETMDSWTQELDIVQF